MTGNGLYFLKQNLELFMLNRNFNARNFGLRSRDPVMAAKNALQEHAASFGSISTNVSHFRVFESYMKDVHGVKDMRWYEQENIVQFAEQLNEKIESGELTLSTGHDRLAAINTIMQQARQDKALWTSPVQYLGQRNGIRTESRALTQIQLRQHVSYLSEQKFGDRLSAVHELTHSIGLRFEEASKYDSRKALEEAISQRKINIDKGTKGGRHREIDNISNQQIIALRKAAMAQGSEKSLIPQELSYKQWRNFAYKALKNSDVKGWHPGRHTFTQNRYIQITGTLPPVAAGIKHGLTHHKYMAEKLNISVAKAKALDKSARITIARELGHNRTVITNSYLG